MSYMYLAVDRVSSHRDSWSR